MSHRIAGIDVHKKMLAVVVADVESEASTSLNGVCLVATPPICDYWPTG